AIYDLHQTSGNGVKVISEGKMIALHPGNMIFLSRENTDDFSKIDHDCKLIGYNDPRHKKLSDNVDAFSMDFSIPSVIKKVQPFRHMMNSTEKRDRLMIRKLIMNAVLLRDQMP
ncbi:MAG: hypothetical protein K8F91_21005, partial [Candidatus Obscuribacterales bacterium]|nr:hypothetical protein [Candidatus Obscuribacterales bacterium]